VARVLTLYAAVAVALLVVVGCGTAPDGQSALAGDPAPSATSPGTPTTVWVPTHVSSPHEGTLPPSPRVMIATPSTVAPGGTVALTYDDPVDGLRGGYFVMTDASGTPVAGLWSDRYAEAGPGWTSDVEHMEVLDFPVFDAGPDTVIVPDVLEPGEYTLCTENAAPNVCTTLTVTAP